MTRQVDEINMRLHENGVSSLRIRISGGKTGEHMIDCLAGEWHCDCIGYMSHGHCVHVDIGKVIKQHIDMGLLTLQEKIGIGEARS